MKFAILADIHGNSSALTAVLADMAAVGIREAVNLGDHFSGPFDAHGTAELLMARNFPTIRGNHDRWLVEKQAADMCASDRTALAQLEPAQLDWVRGLPSTCIVFDEVFLCHGTPTSDQSYWLERVEPNGQVRSARACEIESEADGISASLILCGHTHIPKIIRLRDGRVVANPGSVGCPGYQDDMPVPHFMQTGTPNASYAIAEKVDGDWLITFRSVPYDRDVMVQLAQSNGRADWARAIATGWVEA